jgi:hypothetical protein
MGVKVVGKISEFTVTKGFTRKAEDRDEWVKAEYSVKAIVEGDEEVQVAKAQVEGLVDGWLSSAFKPSPSQAPSQTEKPKAPTPPKPKASAKSVRQVFPEDLADMLSFEEQGEWVIIKPRQFLGSENFAKIAEVVRSQGGDYVSAGKESHFRVPR